jgi:hypothetical protein
MLLSWCVLALMSFTLVAPVAQAFAAPTGKMSCCRMKHKHGNCCCRHKSHSGPAISSRSCASKCGVSQTNDSQTLWTDGVSLVAGAMVQCVLEVSLSPAPGCSREERYQLRQRPPPIFLHA